MKVLIVESNPNLGDLWKRHMQRMGAEVFVVSGQNDAITLLQDRQFDILVLDLVLGDGSALAVADFTSYRYPDTRVIFVTNTSFFSDGSIFQHCQNACAFMPTSMPPEDLVAMVEHYGMRQGAN